MDVLVHNIYTDKTTRCSLSKFLHDAQHDSCHYDFQLRYFTITLTYYLFVQSEFILTLVSRMLLCALNKLKQNELIIRS